MYYVIKKTEVSDNFLKLSMTVMYHESGTALKINLTKDRTNVGDNV